MVFTVALLVTHVVLICSNMSTVEQLGMRRMREREKRVLGRLHAWWQFRYVSIVPPSLSIVCSFLSCPPMY